MNHKFGGIWTRKKLDILSKYLAFYCQALKKQPFNLHYADAFAGTGTHIPTNLNDEQEVLIDQGALEGSVRAALNIEPGFHKYHFNDLDPAHVRELEQLKQSHQQKEICISQLDANQFVEVFCKSLQSNDRAVLFVDPYSSELDWDTLRYVASSQKVDLWLLFPISVIIRMTPKSEERIRPEWKPTLNRLLGTDQWEQSLYQCKEEPRTRDLFGGTSNEPVKERLNTEELGRWVTERLKELFPYVSDPVALNNNNRPLFNFYFIVSNPNKKAQSLAQRVVKHILKNE